MLLVPNIFRAGIALTSTVLLLLPGKTDAGPAMPACLALCTSICAPLTPGGLTVAACMALCTPGCFVSCFSNQTVVNVSVNGENINKYIDEVNAGDMVLTYSNGEPEYTKVLRNQKTEGSFEGVKITAQNLQNTSQIEHLEVTLEHGLVFSHASGPMTVNTAAHTQVEDTLIGSNGSRLSVISIEKSILYAKYTLETYEGTVLASNVFVTTLCSEEVAGGERLFDLAMEDWHARHSFGEVHDLN